MASTFALMISSCSKDEIRTDDPPGSAGQYDMYYQILSFIETMQGNELTQPQIQPRTVYSPSDVILYVEGAMNLQYTDPRTSWANYENKTDTFTIAISSGYANQAAVNALFAEVQDSASAHFYSITEPDKFPALYDATILTQSASLVTLSVLSKVGTVYRDPTPFGSTDYWSVWGGKCSPYSGGSLEASQVISNALNDYYAPYGCTFFSNVVTIDQYTLQSYGWDQPNANDPTPDDFIIDFRTYVYYCWDYQMWGDPEEWPECDIENGFPDCGDFNYENISCLDPSEMNFYFESIRGIYLDYLDAQSNPYLMHIVSNIRLASTLCLETAEFWEAEISFGQPNSCYNSNYPTYLPACCQ
jgi:hypothetical protein